MNMIALFVYSLQAQYRRGQVQPHSDMILAGSLNGESCSVLSPRSSLSMSMPLSDYRLPSPVRLREATRASPPRANKKGRRLRIVIFRCRVHVVSLTPRVTIVIVAGPLSVQKGAQDASAHSRGVIITHSGFRTVSTRILYASLYIGVFYLYLGSL